MAYTGIVGGRFALLIACLFCAGCESSLAPAWQQPLRLPLPNGAPGTPAPTPTPPFVGDGADGDRTFLSGSLNSVNDCLPVTLGSGAAPVTAPPTSPDPAKPARASSFSS